LAGSCLPAYLCYGMLNDEDIVNSHI